MIRRSVEISREPCHLSVRDEQLLISRRGATGEKGNPETAGSIPLEDLGILMVDEPGTTYTHAVLTKVAEYGGALVVCGRDHLPSGMFVSLPTNTELLSRLDAQVSLGKPGKKRLWSAIVAAKVRAQARNLRHKPQVRARLLSMIRRIRSGDPDNVEAQAAREYWPALLDNHSVSHSVFRRRPGESNAAPPNHLLDYGYAVIRAAVARAIVSAGLLPAIGIQHRGRSNFFCLADDLMEPLRPLVDAKVRMLFLENKLTLDQPTKAELIAILANTVRLDTESGPLGVVIHRYVASFVQAISESTEKLEVPCGMDKPENATPIDDDLDNECI